VPEPQEQGGIVVPVKGWMWCLLVSLFWCGLAGQTDPASDTFQGRAWGMNADFCVVNETGYTPLPVYFYDTSMTGTGTIRTWLWEFGDGGTSSEQNPVYVYQIEGIYSVRLTVTNEYGNSSSVIREGLIRVWRPDMLYDPGLKICGVLGYYCGGRIGFLLPSQGKSSWRVCLNSEFLFSSRGMTAGPNLELRHMTDSGLYSAITGGIDFVHFVIKENPDEGEGSDYEVHTQNTVFPRLTAALGYQDKLGDKLKYFIEIDGGFKWPVITLHLGLIF
jgi:hypothetical protein